MQRCGTVGSFTISIGFASLFLQTITVYLSSQITTLEKVFNIDSTTSGTLLSCNDIGYLATVLVTSHFIRKRHIPRVLGVSTMIYALSGVLSGLLYFMDPSALPRGSSMTDDVTNASYAGDGGKYLCSQSGRESRQNETCEAGSDRPLEKNRKRTGLLLGALICLTMFGPALAFSFGGVFSQIPVDLSPTSLTPQDPRWIGAWWLGFLVFGGVSVVTAVPLFFFPKKIKGRQFVPSDDDKEQTFCGKVKDLPLSLFRVVSNPVYTVNNLAMVTGTIAAVGLISFGAKYLETIFNIPAWKSNLFLGVIVVITTILGTFLGGVIATRFKLERSGCLKVMIGTYVLATLAQCLNFQFWCDNQTIRGLQRNQERVVLDEGPSTCDCLNVPFLPVCKGNVTFFSPCHAGCHNQTDTTYGGCLSAGGGSVSPSFCDTGCPYLYPYVAATALFALSGSIAIVPGYLVLIRSVAEKDKAMAVGLYSCSVSVLVYLPVPIVYGKIIDTTCIVWNYACGARGSCALYDLVDLRLKITGMNVCGNAVTAVLSVMALFLLKWRNNKPEKSKKLAPETFSCISRISAMSTEVVGTSLSLLSVVNADNKEDPIGLNVNLPITQETPNWRRRITGLGSFTFFAGAASLCLQTVTVYIASQVPTIEKVLNIDSTTSGVIMSCNDIGFLTTILFSSHVLRTSHIPRVLGVCTIVYGCASFLCSIPHFLNPAVLPRTSELRNISSEQFHLCTSQGRNLRGRIPCDDDGRGWRASKSWSIALFAVCLLVQGAVKAPRTPLVTEYIDNNVIQKRHTSVLLGSVLTLGVFGLAVAFVMGGIFSAIPVDLSDTTLTRRDPRWIGAWWLGFLVLGVISVALAVPLFIYPKQQNSRPLAPTEEQTFWMKVKDVPKSVFRVLRNPVYLFTLLAMVGLNIRALGLIVFGSKYMEHVFSVPIWQSSMFIGIGVMLLSGNWSWVLGAFSVGLWYLVLRWITEGASYLQLEPCCCPQLLTA
ncbi:solute carrier organic anion transporter family member 2A1-like [Haliotis rubra]|uniref:solute carrier organic anion transporter family member 2A1-like n=1 Tax=Haliotis rubra TaxID=36100 RepID=UPI001EE52221|nr:solute carrier organic anion transporter family member 2A1-like [Haliotis rubra]